MSRINADRPGCKDVFHSFMVANATYAHTLEIPCIKPETSLPTKLISFSKSISSSDTDSWIHFYEDDVCFERVWSHPHRYLPILKKYAGVIAPDFSLYRDMPLVNQVWNIYRSRAIATWLQDNGIAVIPNVRWGDERTFDVCCAGISKHSVIAIGSHGCIKLAGERTYFQNGLAYVVDSLLPRTIIVYGSAPASIFGKYKKVGVDILCFSSDCALAHRKVVNI